jgi:hypothetical protein
MDTPTLFATSGTTAGVIAVALAIYKAVNHKQCRSRCCGRTASVSFDAGSTSVSPNTTTPFVISKPNISAA